MTLPRSIGIRMDEHLDGVIRRLAKQSGMRMDAYIRHVLREGLGLKPRPVKLYIVP